MTFPALRESYRWLLGFVIGSLRCSFLLWLVRVIPLVLVFRQSFENRSIQYLVDTATLNITVWHLWANCFQNRKKHPHTIFVCFLLTWIEFPPTLPLLWCRVSQPLGSNLPFQLRFSWTRPKPERQAFEKTDVCDIQQKKIPFESFFFRKNA